ncbi:hypothetical protein F904_00478 [Acinetobacter dispersus]|uniref:Uncharacterized protein n=1 Tax=Acinetobacter dispersus TaxID=70348 RepID=N9LFT1_9GAMM|nr:hypothetical protein F904_00478 [Acinetobacter dispersus]
MLSKMRKSFYVQFWILPLFLFYFIEFFNGQITIDIYSIFLLIISVFFIFFCGVFAFFFHEDLYDFYGVKFIPKSRIIALGIKVHLLTIFVLLMMYIGFLNLSHYLKDI